MCVHAISLTTTRVSFGRSLLRATMLNYVFNWLWIQASAIKCLSIICRLLSHLQNPQISLSVLTFVIQLHPSLCPPQVRLINIECKALNAAVIVWIAAFLARISVFGKQECFSLSCHFETWSGCKLLLCISINMSILEKQKLHNVLF